MLSLFSHNEIDKLKWDDCVTNSKRSSVYALSWYLDTVSPDWKGLINDDYTVVIPLCWRKKMSVKYLFQPPYTQFGGAFSNHTEQIDFSVYTDQLGASFKFIEIRINPSNYAENKEEVSVKAINQFINLKSDLIEIEKSIHPTHRKNIRRATKANITVESIEPSEFLDFKFSNQGGYDEDVSMLPLLVETLQKQKAITCYAAFNSAHEMVTAIMLIEHENRSILITSATTDEGKNNKAMFLLVSHCLKLNAGKDHLFDFAGSSLSGVYEFNKGFGASEENINCIRINNLPPLVKFLKR